MVTRTIITYLALTLGLALVVVSCQSHTELGNIDLDNRWVSVSTALGLTAQDQLKAYAIPDIHPKQSDRVSHVEWLIKAELDFGDGSGWIDVTQLYIAFQSINSIADFRQFACKHEYTQPGAYTIKARATFWDGNVITTFSDGSQAISQITVPPAR